MSDSHATKAVRSGIPDDISGVRYDRTKPTLTRPHSRVKKSEQAVKEPDMIVAQSAYRSMSNRLPSGWLMMVDPDAKAPIFFIAKPGH